MCASQHVVDFVENVTIGLWALGAVFVAGPHDFFILSSEKRIVAPVHIPTMAQLPPLSGMFNAHGMLFIYSLW